MRCLYCGKGLALLKRLRGGGEFCSDAHRLKYQEEYNQLALSRLLQAKPQEEAAAGEAAQNGQSHNGAGLNGQHAEPAFENTGGNGGFTPGPGAPAPASTPAYAQTESTMATALATVDSPYDAPPGLAGDYNSPAAHAETSAEIDSSEHDAPAPMAGFLRESPLPQDAETAALVQPGLFFDVVVRPEQPRH